MWSWSRKMLKTRAKEILKMRYWPIFIAIVSIIAGITSIITVFSLVVSRFISNARLVFPVIGIFIVLFIIFVINVIEVGRCRYMIQARQGSNKLRILFWAFRKGRYMKVVTTMLICGLYIFVSYLFLIIPGIMRGLEYYYVPYILAENPDIEPLGAMELSKKMTDGEKFKIFILELSFLGWVLIVALASEIGRLVGGIGNLVRIIGSIFIALYTVATSAELYAFVRERLIANDITN